MDISIIVAIIIGVICIILLFRLLSKKSESRKFLSIRQFILCIVVLGIIIVVCASLVGKKIYRNGIGELFTDYAEAKVEENSHNSNATEAGDALIITVSLDKIQIDNVIYSDVDSTQQVIADAVSNGKELRVIDDYALATTYNDLIDAIILMNVSRHDIEEIKQP